MSRVKRGVKRNRRRKKILRLAKGYWGAKGRLHQAAKEQVNRSLAYSYRDRRQKKRNFRRLWIIRVNAAAREHSLSYSQFMYGLKKAGLELSRKMLADLAIRDPKAFGKIADMARSALH